jgi:hypothetical protein
MITAEEYTIFPAKLIPASLLPPKRNYENPIQIFDQDKNFRQQYMKSILDTYTRTRRNIYYQKHGEPLALSVQDYINVIINRKKYNCELLLSDILNLSKTEFTLENFIKLSFYERLLSRKNNTE